MNKNDYSYNLLNRSDSINSFDHSNLKQNEFIDNNNQSIDKSIDDSIDDSYNKNKHNNHIPELGKLYDLTHNSELSDTNNNDNDNNNENYYDEELDTIPSHKKPIFTIRRKVQSNSLDFNRSITNRFSNNNNNNNNGNNSDNNNNNNNTITEHDRLIRKKKHFNKIIKCYYISKKAFFKLNLIYKIIFMIIFFYFLLMPIKLLFLINTITNEEIDNNYLVDLFFNAEEDLSLDEKKILGKDYNSLLSGRYENDKEHIKGGLWYIPPSWIQGLDETKIPNNIKLEPKNIVEAANLLNYLSLLKKESRFMYKSNIPLIVHELYKTSNVKKWPINIRNSIHSWLSFCTPSGWSEIEGKNNRPVGYFIQNRKIFDLTYLDKRNSNNTNITNSNITNDKNTTIATNSKNTIIIKKKKNLYKRNNKNSIMTKLFPNLIPTDENAYPYTITSSGNEGVGFILWNDYGMKMAIEEYLPNFAKTYNSLPIPVLKADFFRIFIIETFGGIYADSDTKLLRNPAQWIQNDDLFEWSDFYRKEKQYIYKLTEDVNAIIGIECDVDPKSSSWWRMSYGHALEITNWAFAGSKNHELFKKMMDKIIHDIKLKIKIDGLESLKSIDPIVYTGPYQWTEVAIDYLNSHVSNFNWYSLTGRFDSGKSKGIHDILVLPITAFSPGRNYWYGNMGSKSTSDSSARLNHLGTGTWKHKSFKSEFGKLCRTLFGLCRDWPRV